jgi:protein-tyrosine-phosphatase
MAGPAYDIPDPYGQGEREYELMYKELADLVERGGPRIAQLAQIAG